MAKFQIRETDKGQFFVEENIGGNDWKIVKIRYSKEKAVSILRQLEEGSKMAAEIGKKLKLQKENN